MTSTLGRAVLSAALAAAAACGSSSPEPGATPDAASVVIDAAVGPVVDAESCEPPDLLIVLDRTQSMYRTPANTIPENTLAGRATSKWALAVTAVEALTVMLGDTVRFGLELFPLDPGGGACVTLEQRIAGTTATNVTCQGGEVPVVPDLATGAAIGAAIDVETTRLCNSTPIGAALGTATTQLAAITVAGRDQHVLLLTDGKNGCTDDASVTAAVQQLAATGVTTYVVGFGTGGTDGVDSAQLNQLACAGRTAKDFATACVADAGGDYTAVDPLGPALYFDAQDAASLAASLSAIAGSVCCGCLL